jgi:hypothetical protein
MVGRGRRSLIARGGIGAAVPSPIALGPPSFALGNYCVSHPTTEGCKIPQTEPHITAASISHASLHLELTFTKPLGPVVASCQAHHPIPTAESRGRDLRRQTDSDRIPSGDSRDRDCPTADGCARKIRRASAVNRKRIRDFRHAPTLAGPSESSSSSRSTFADRVLPWTASHMSASASHLPPQRRLGFAAGVRQ